MSTSNVVTQREMNLATTALDALSLGAMMGKIGVVPVDLNGVRVMALTANMEDVDDQGGNMPLAVVVNADLLRALEPAEGKITVEPEEESA